MQFYVGDKNNDETDYEVLILELPLSRLLLFLDADVL
jgi:hypothetical protein